MLIMVEGIALCFVLLLVCSVAIANGPVGAVFFYEQDVQDRVVELKLTTRETIRRRYGMAGLCLCLPLFIGAPAMVYYLNGARTFLELFWQITAVLMIPGIFDRLFIDWYWVGRTNAWLIPGTEDLKPYVPRKVMIGKWAATLVGYPLIAALAAWVITLL